MPAPGVSWWAAHFAAEKAGFDLRHDDGLWLLRDDYTDNYIVHLRPRHNWRAVFVTPAEAEGDIQALFDTLRKDLLEPGSNA